MPIKKQRETPSIKEFERTCIAIGARIAAFRKAKRWEQSSLAHRIGTGLDAIRKIESGKNLNQYVKLVELAKALGVTPNEILNFPQQNEHDAFLGAMEAAFLSQGMPLEQVRPLAEVALEALNSPEVRSAGIPVRDSARIVVLVAIRKFCE